jgi:hypothetical protein
VSLEHLRDGVVNGRDQLDAVVVACGRQQGAFSVKGE